MLEGRAPDLRVTNAPCGHCKLFFAPDTRMERSVQASFEDLDGSMRHYGTGASHFRLSCRTPRV
jgi:hypothetical protein